MSLQRRLAAQRRETCPHCKAELATTQAEHERVCPVPVWRRLATAKDLTGALR